MNIMTPLNLMLSYYGEPCPDYEPGCAVCDGWAEFNETGYMPGMDDFINDEELV